MKEEQELFSDLRRLCTSPGYVHALAHICFNDNFISFQGELSDRDMRHLFSPERAIRTETSTLLGLLVTEPIDFALPEPSNLKIYIEQTYVTLDELHRSFLPTIDHDRLNDKNYDPYSNGAALREPIFYSGEAAYSFQFRDLAPIKYHNDNDWLKANKGFSIQEARQVVHAITTLQNRKSIASATHIVDTQPADWTYLPILSFTTQELEEVSSLPALLISSILNTFAAPEGSHNAAFLTLSDFNSTNAAPLLRHNGTYILFNQCSLAEALYDSPFYWMMDDSNYRNTAMQHRGYFTETFSLERLQLVFGKDRVHSNVNLHKGLNKIAGEIDTLVVFGDRAIVLQAKSKKLTVEARKGNDNKIQSDFKQSVQDAYNQGRSCADLLIEGKCTLLSKTQPVTIPSKLKEIYIFCVVSEHYPALSLQTMQFLEYKDDEKITPPFVMDIFTLDVLTEILTSPLYFISYIERRTRYSNKLFASHELTILAAHLRSNMWLDENCDGAFFEDGISAELDAAMVVRRDHLPGKRTPAGILTRFEGTYFNQLLEEIGSTPQPDIIELGLMLLSMSEDAVSTLNEAMDSLLEKTRKDGKNHDSSIAFSNPQIGFTIHCNVDATDSALSKLYWHSEIRKYANKSDKWFGICICPDANMLRFGVNFIYKWQYDATLENLLPSFPPLGVRNIRS